MVKLPIKSPRNWKTRMSSFTDPMSVTQIRHNDTGAVEWRLDKDFTYYLDEEGSDRWVTVKKGFVFDGGSIPRFAWSIVGSPMGEGGQAYCLHDVLYASEALPRLLADQIMYDGLAILGYWWWRRSIVYRCVRTFGGFVWDAHTIESVTAARHFVDLSPTLIAENPVVA